MVDLRTKPRYRIIGKLDPRSGADVYLGVQEPRKWEDAIEVIDNIFC
jgi:hypothetical protein